MNNLLECDEEIIVLKQWLTEMTDENMLKLNSEQLEIMLNSKMSTALDKLDETMYIKYKYAIAGIKKELLLRHQYMNNGIGLHMSLTKHFDKIAWLVVYGSVYYSSEQCRDPAIVVKTCEYISLACKSIRLLGITYIGYKYLPSTIQTLMFKAKILLKNRFFRWQC